MCVGGWVCVHDAVVEIDKIKVEERILFYSETVIFEFIE